MGGDERVVFITESELDALGVRSAGRSAYGAPGAASWHKVFSEELVSYGARRAVVLGDADEAGRKFNEKVVASLREHDIDAAVGTLPAGVKDITETLITVPVEARGELLEDIAKDTFGQQQAPTPQSLPPASENPFVIAAAQGAPLPKTNATTASLATVEPPSLAFKPDLLAEVDDILARCGVVGERTATRLIFLCVVSRLLTKIVSAIIRGPSSAGKSWTLGRVLDLFPDTAYHAVTGGSEKSLVYSEEPLAHRIIVFFEAGGVFGEMGAMLMRSLLSEGRLVWDTVKDMEPLHLEREGPTGFLTTTTAITIDAELETRLLSVTIDDSRNQTRDVLLSLAEETSGRPPDLSEWRRLQDWLAAGPCEVTVPYARALAELVSPTAVRMRRDFASVLGLIRAHALLHRATRTIDAQGRVVATLADYAAVHDLVADLISAGVEASAPATVRETVGAVAALFDGAGVPLGALAKRLELDKSAASRRAKTAISNGYLKNLEERAGRPARYCVDEPLPDDGEILPTPEKLEAALGVAGVVGVAVDLERGPATEGPLAEKNGHQNGVATRENFREFLEAARS